MGCVATVREKRINRQDRIDEEMKGRLLLVKARKINA